MSNRFSFPLSDLDLESEGWMPTDEKKNPYGYCWDSEKNIICEVKFDNKFFPGYIKNGEFFCNSAYVVSGGAVAKIYQTKRILLGREAARLNEKRQNLMKKHYEDLANLDELENKLKKVKL